jgi:dienelactone hydrolase
VLIALVALLLAAPTQTEYTPPSGQGRAVIMLSGHSGPPLYVSYAQHLAAAGYYVVLLDGKDILNRDRQGDARLDLAIARVQASPHALPGKVAVIGFSQGGGGALDHAATKPKHVAVVVAYYPETDFILPGFKDVKTFVRRFDVPIVVYAGVKDTYNACCFIETARALQSYAQQLGKLFELVEYPNAHHGFNLATQNFREADSADAWTRTLDTLHHYLDNQARN